MLGLRSLLGLVLSLVIHGAVAAYLITQTPLKEQPKPKKITLAMEIFQEASAPVKEAPIAKPVELATPVVKPVTPPQPIVKPKTTKAKVDKKPTLKKKANKKEESSS